jgi:hypothetical protein
VAVFIGQLDRRRVRHSDVISGIAIGIAARSSPARVSAVLSKNATKGK